MRHLILALLIALLPIRGWVGEVMATEMASSRSAHMEVTPEKIADDADAAWSGGHFGHEPALKVAADTADPTVAQADCPDHDAPSHPATHAGCDACTVCQACHSVGLFADEKNGTASPNPIALPPSPLARFASADPAPGLKPPIS